MRRILLVIGVVVLAAGALAWWLMSEPQGGPTGPATAPAAGVVEAPFVIAAVDEAGLDAGVGRVAGRVESAEGAPVAGARVRLYAQSPELERLECGVCQLPVLECDDPSTVRRVIQGLRSGSLHAPEPAAETVSAEDGTFSFEGAPLGGEVFAVFGRQSARQPTDTEALALTLEPAISHDLRVVDDQGTPIAAVAVTLYSPLEGTSVERKTNGEGVVSLETLDRGAWVFAEKDGALPAGRFFESVEALTLTPPRTLIIRTRMGAKPVDAEVTIDLHRQARKLKTRDGVLRLEQLPHGYYTVGVSSETLAAAEQSFELAQPVTELEFELRRGSKLLVTVLSPTGDPLEQVSGTLSGNDANVNADAEKGAMLILGPVPEGEYTLTLNAEGMVSVNRPIDLKPGETTLEVTLRTAPKLAGTVLSPDGKPVGMVRVSAFEGDVVISFVLSGEDGHFEIELQYPGSFSLRAEDPKTGVGEAKAKVPGPPVTITLDAKGVLEVEVVDFDGKPLPPDLLVRSEKDQNAQWVPADGPIGRLAGLRSGKYVLEKTMPERLPLTATADVVEGQVTRVTLKADPGASVTGKVVDHQGQPVEGATVTVGGRNDVVNTLADGRFELKGVAPGEVELFAVHPTGAESNKVKVKAPARDVVLTVPEIAQVSGRVVDAAGGVVRTFDANGEKVTSDDGRFHVKAPNHTLDIWVDGYVSMFLATAEGDVGDVVVKKVPVAEGDVVDAEGKPVSGASVMGSVDATATTSDANGRFKLTINSEYPQELIATRGSSSGRTSVKIGSPVHIAMQKGTTIVGKVLDGSGRPTLTLVTAVSRNVMRPLEIDTDENGRFQLELSQGVWLFSTRSNRVSRAIDVHGDHLELTLGEESGACGAVVRSTKTIDGLWFLVTPMGPSDGPWETVGRAGGNVEVPISIPALEIPVRGIPCGRYTLAASIENMVTTVPVDLRSAAQPIDVPVPLSSADPDERAP